VSDKTGIVWTEATWNPTTGCDKVSPGCDHCYALRMARRLKAMGNPKYQRDGDPRTSGPGFAVTVHPDVVHLPLRWRTPRRVFVNSMSDLFHPRVSDEWLVHIFAVMAVARQHTFQVLTKRSPRARTLLGDDRFAAAVRDRTAGKTKHPELLPWQWPLPNVWHGVTVEGREQYRRLDDLIQTPAAVRWVSAEPLLDWLDLRPWLWLTGPSTAGPWYDHAGRYRGGGGIGGQAISSVPSGDIHWVVTGGESGPGARPADPVWFRDIRDQCAEAEVAYLHKQNGGRAADKGGRELDGVIHDAYPAGGQR